MMQANFGLYGEFRLEVYSPDGTIRESLDWQPNLITDSGLDAIGISAGFAYYCGVGSGNNLPQNNHDALQHEEAVISYANNRYPFEQSPRLIIDTTNRMIRKFETYKYVFTRGTLNNKNITEIGLCTTFKDPATNGWETRKRYTTRALIKDMSGNPTTISVRADEELIVFYRIWGIIPFFEKEVVLDCPTKSGDTTTSTKKYKLKYQPNRKTNMFKFLDKPDAPPPSGKAVTLSEYPTSRNEWVGGMNTTLNATEGTAVDNQNSVYTSTVIQPAYVMGSYELNYQSTIAAQAFHRGKKPGRISSMLMASTHIELIVDVFNEDGTEAYIPKTEEYEFIASFKVKWARYTGDTSIIKEN